MVQSIGSEGMFEGRFQIGINNLICQEVEKRKKPKYPVYFGLHAVLIFIAGYSGQ
jgi:hypothetical protein